jgi:hypothetical protein
VKPSEGSAFIAYDLKDADEAENLAAALEAQGVDVWLGWRDKRTIRDATDYAAQLREAAADCGTLLLLLTGRKVDMEELGELTQLAYAADKPIYLVRTSENAEVPDFPALLRAEGVVDAFGGDRDAALGRLAGRLGGTGSGAAQAEAGESAGQQASAETEAPAPAAPGWPTPPASPPAAPPTQSGWPQQPAAPAPASSWPTQPQAPAPAAPAPAWPQPAQAPAATAGGGWPQATAPAAPAAASWPATPGAAAAAPAAAWQPPGGPPMSGENEQRLREYVGPNSDYYLRKWGDMDRSRSSTSWNFAAFFLSGFWLAYRKMVLPALLLVGAFYASGVIGMLHPGLGMLTNFGLFGAVIFLGLMGNKFYRNQAERALADPAASHPGALQGRGGTSVGLALGLLAAYLVLLGVTAYVFMDQRMGIFYQPSYGSGYSTGGGTSTVTTPSMDSGPMGNTSATTATTPTGTTVWSSWLAGKWGLTGTNCASWVQFNSNGTLIDNVGTGGSWTLNNYTSTLTLSIPGGAREGRVSRQGETLIITSPEGRQEWQRCY